MAVGPQYLPQVAVPLSATVFTTAPRPTPEATWRVACLSPFGVGLNTTLIVQVDLTGTDVPQVLLCENCAGFWPATLMLVIGTAIVPVLDSVTGVALATPSAWLPNKSWLGASEKLTPGVVTV